MEAVSSQMVAAAKLPVLNPGEFELWKMRIEQYFLMTDYALWEVIVNGDSPPPKRTVDGVEQTYPPTTAEEKLARKNELKARGNKESKKMHKTILKQQYENFTASRSEGLDKTNDKFQKLISQLEIHGERQASSSTYADDVMFFIFANQSNSPQLDNEDLEQIDTDDLEDMDLKWQAKEGITNFALMAYISQGYQIGLELLEARIVVHEKNEAVYEEDIAFLKYDVQVKD
ncbi:hypothetical protein Tco_0918154, partial [Tanacetum coccineum]